MRIWLVKTGEPIPGDGGDVKLLRTGLLARELASRGHEVVWWTAAFDHHAKRLRATRTESRVLEGGGEIVLLRSPGYPRNVSPRRFYDHAVVAREFAREAEKRALPDAIVCAMPTPDLALRATRYGRAHGVPVLLDIRDWWPDVLVELLPRPFRALGRVAVAPYARMLRRAARDATALSGVTPEILAWGLARAGRPSGPLDRAFPLGFSAIAPPPADVARAVAAWEARGLRGRDREVAACFIGTFSTHKLDMETVLDAARILERRGTPVRIVLAGRGDAEAAYRERAKGLESVMFAGWVDRSQMWALMQLSTIGLAPYGTSTSYEASVPTKAIEYMAGGLAVVSSLGGNLERLARERDIGMTYRKGDAEGLAAILAALAGDPQRCARMARNGRELYEKEFVAERVYAEMADHIEVLARAGRFEKRI